MLPYDLREVKPNILVDVLIGINTVLFSVFSLDREESLEWSLVTVRFYLNSKSSFSASTDFKYRWNFLGYSFRVTLGNSLDSLSNWYGVASSNMGIDTLGCLVAAFSQGYAFDFPLVEQLSAHAGRLGELQVTIARVYFQWKLPFHFIVICRRISSRSNRGSLRLGVVRWRGLSRMFSNWLTEVRVLAPCDIIEYF